MGLSPLYICLINLIYLLIFEPFCKIMGNGNTKKQSFAEKMDLQRRLVDAVIDNNTQLVNDLIYYENADPNILTLPSGHQWRPIHYAAVYGSIDTLKFLMHSQNISPNQKDAYGWLPIHLSVFNGHIECTKLLLMNGSLQTKTERNYPGKHETKNKTPQEIAKLVKDYRHMELFNQSTTPSISYVYPSVHIFGESGK